MVSKGIVGKSSFIKEITYLVRCELQYKPLQNFVIFEYYDAAVLVSRSPLRRIDN